jgi:hypothetical protein
LPDDVFDTEKILPFELRPDEFLKGALELCVPPHESLVHVVGDELHACLVVELLQQPRRVFIVLAELAELEVPFHVVKGQGGLVLHGLEGMPRVLQHVLGEGGLFAILCLMDDVREPAPPLVTAEDFFFLHVHRIRIGRLPPV